MADLYGLLTAADNNTQQNNDNEAYRQAQALQNTVLFDNLIKNISGNPIAANVAANLLSDDDKNNNNNNQQTTQEQEQEQLQEQAAQAVNNLYQNTTTKNAAPSWLNDISGGYKENRNTPLSLANLAENTTSDGRQKGFAYRLGEGLGSLARLAESPIGRGLLMGGTVLATNGTPLQALTYGTVTAAGNQGNRLRDNTYRQQLEAEGIDTSKLGSGYLTDSTYENTINTANKRKELDLKDREMEMNETKAEYENRLKQLQTEEAQIKNSYLEPELQAKLLQENAKAQQETAKGYYAMDTELASLQQKQAVTENVIEKTKGEKIENQYKPQKLQNDIALQNIDIKYKPLKNQADIYSIYDDSNYKWSDLNEKIKQNNIENQREANKAAKEAQDDKYQNPRIMLGNIEQLWKKMPQSRALKGTSKLVGLATGLANWGGVQNNNMAAFDSMISATASQLARSIAGEKGVLTDQDRKYALKMLPSAGDSYEQGMAKLKAVYKLLDDVERGQLSGSSAKMINEYGLSNLASQNTKFNGGKVYSF